MRVRVVNNLFLLLMIFYSFLRTSKNLKNQFFGPLRKILILFCITLIVNWLFIFHHLNFNFILNFFTFFTCYVLCKLYLFIYYIYNNNISKSMIYYLNLITLLLIFCQIFENLRRFLKIFWLYFRIFYFFLYFALIFI